MGENKGLSPDEFSADSITGCTRTTANKLSVWRSETTDFKSDYVEKLIVALATTMPSPATIDLVWLKEEWFLNMELHWKIIQVILNMKV